MKNRITLLSLACATVLSASSIKSIEYLNVSKVSPQVLEETLGMRTGDSLDSNKLNEALIKFYSYGYFDDIVIDNDNGKIANGINNLSNIINHMLVENKTNGLTLEESSKMLLFNVNKLNLSSNEAAASLEETAAALEEITSNIRNNTESIAKMSMLSNGVTKAVNEGQAMANQTTTAMDEINTQGNL